MIISDSSPLIALAKERQATLVIMDDRERLYIGKSPWNHGYWDTWGYFISLQVR